MKILVLSLLLLFALSDQVYALGGGGGSRQSGASSSGSTGGSGGSGGGSVGSNDQTNGNEGENTGYILRTDENPGGQIMGVYSSEGGTAVNNFSVAPVPEPATLLLIGAGLLGLLGARRKLKR